MDNKNICIDFVSRETGEVHAGFGVGLLEAIFDLAGNMGYALRVGFSYSIYGVLFYESVLSSDFSGEGNTIEQAIFYLGKSMGYEVFIKEKAEGWKK